MRPIIVILFLLIASQSVAATYLSDGFESGNLSSPTTNGSSSWGATNNAAADALGVSTDRAHSGTRSLKFTFTGNANTSDDAWAEQRLNSLPASQENWGRMWVFIPSNYYHRNVTPNNNKFWAIYASPYEVPGFQINLSTYALAGGLSGLVLHTYHNGVEQAQIFPHNGFIGNGDLGAWMELIVRVKVPTTSTSADGIIQVWKNGVRIANYTSLNIYGNNGRNYIDQMYLLGWSNSGFANTTDFYIDDVLISDTEITSTYGGATITCYQDADNDLYGNGISEIVSSCTSGYYISSHFTSTTGDCNDSNQAINPGGVEICGDGIDQDCNGSDLACSPTQPRARWGSGAVGWGTGTTGQ